MAETPEPPPKPPHHEERTVRTEHELTIGDRTIPYTAVASRLILADEDGEKQASFFSIAYLRSDVDDPTGRPVVFAFNGGPGSSSVWLHLGVLGPMRVELDDEGTAPAPPGRLVPNQSSLLDAADLVFIDPVGTGFSRGLPGDKTTTYAHFTRDIESVGAFIHLWLSRHGRWASPKYLAGESYGTTRAAGLAAHLHDRYGVYVNGLILVSAVLNFATAGWDRKTWTFAVGHDLPYVLFLPTYAATAWFHGRAGQGRSLAEFVDEVEEFALTDYAAALMRGDLLDPDAFEDTAESLAGYTGLPLDYIRQHRLRIEILRFCKELLRDVGLTVGRLDSRYTGTGRFDAGESMETDPSADAIAGAYAAMLNDHVRRRLGYTSDLAYEVLNEKVFEAWDYEDFKDAYVDVSERLRQVMSRNPHLRVYVANGYYDLATPHFATEYTFAHAGLRPDARDRVEMAYFEAGHMMYVHRASLERLGDDLRRFVTT
jgi:carboxypeptidase C (cathepsin A)